MPDDEWVIRWRREILCPPTDNVEVLVTVSSSLRQLSIEFSQSAANLNILELERNGMSLLCNAIMAGAFKGSAWLLWRTRLADRPHIINAAKFLGKYGPLKNMAGSGFPAGWKAGQVAVEIMADAIDVLAKQMVDALPQSSPPVIDGGPSSPPFPAAPLQIPLTDLQRVVFEIIKDQPTGQAISGRKIIQILASKYKRISSQQTLQPTSFLY
jgi:hypothetical protein